MSGKYHFNPNSGEPGECTANIQCRFAVDGVQPQHFSTQEEASLAYESTRVLDFLSSLSKGTEINLDRFDSELDDYEKESKNVQSMLNTPLNDFVEGLDRGNNVSTGKNEAPLTEVEKLQALGEEIKNKLDLNDLNKEKQATATSEEATPEPPAGSMPPENEKLEHVMEDVNALVGMDVIKDHIRNTSNLLKIQAAREKVGLPTVEIGLNRAFVGGPGTGKTTMARLMGRVYKATGRLSKGHLVEVGRDDLVAGFVGQTAEKTKKVLESAKGGVLFIDEAYALTPQGSGSDYGHESISTILKYMEDNRDDFCLIVAGYPKEMQGFLDSNSGLSSRFNDIVQFKDYEPNELNEIMSRNLHKSQYVAEDSVKSKIEKDINWIVANKDENFGNARTIRTYFESVVGNQSDRLATSNVEFTKENLEKLTLDDLPKDLKKIVSLRSN